MNKFKNYILMAAGFAILAGVVAGVTAGPAMAQAIKAALVKNVDERGRTPFAITFSCDGSAFCIGATGAVPAGKRFVVEHANGSAPPNTLISVSAHNNTTEQPEGPVNFLPSTNQTAATSIVNADLLLYIEPLRGVAFSVSGGATIVATTITLTGYLVDLTI